MNAALASVIGEAWGSLDERRFLLLTLIGFVCAFGFIRLSTRLMRSPRVPWWPGSVVSEGGVHMHHLFFGILLMMAAGGLSFAAGETDGPWYAIYAVLFGIGLGLTIDEYALWLHLDDVYWSREGRSSIDATLIALGFFGFVLLAFVPTRIDDDSPAVLATTVIAAAWHFGWVLIAAAKHRLVHAVFGIFLPGLAVYAGLRLAKPRSVWAKRFYGERRPAKQARAEQRFRAGRLTDQTRTACATRSVGSPRRSTRPGLPRPRRRRRQRTRPRRSDRLHRNDPPARPHDRHQAEHVGPLTSSTTGHARPRQHGASRPRSIRLSPRWQSLPRWCDRLGRYIYAVGSNPESARLSGVPVTKVPRFGLCDRRPARRPSAACSFTSRLSAGNPTAATGYELNAIAACVIGGAFALRCKKAARSAWLQER